MMKLNVVICTLVFWICFAVQAQPYTQLEDNQTHQEVLARGMGAVIAGDVAKAEDDAIANALRNAIEQVIGTLVTSEVIVENYQVLEDRIYSQSQGYVESYQVINKNRQGDVILEVTIKALVRKGNIRDNLQALGLLISRKGKPRIMVIVDEKNMNTHYYAWSIDMNTTETEIMNTLLDQGFPFVDRDAAMRKIEKDMVVSAMEGDEYAAQLLATQSGAEVLIVGKAVSKVAPRGPAALAQAGMFSCQATMNLRALRSDDGTILATASKQAAAVHIDELTGGTMALQKAAKLAADDISSKIIDRWQKDVYSGTSISLRLMNVETYSDLIKIKNMLPYYIRGVQNVYQRDFSDNTVLFDLDVRGNANQVAEEMVLKDFNPYKIEVLNVTQNTIIARVSKTNSQEDTIR
ncbi:MAG: DUF2066 domain-containing protein [Calditrichaeota bacterium]|nr:DUF2066 domain-containing protein [Calditrichota bacterium]RQW07694.1 MAG: DUF2066 domain-containing protein [Calditrichota bacterium]